VEDHTNENNVKTFQKHNCIQHGNCRSLHNRSTTYALRIGRIAGLTADNLDDYTFKKITHSSMQVLGFPIINSVPDISDQPF